MIYFQGITVRRESWKASFFLKKHQFQLLNLVDRKETSVDSLSDLTRLKKVTLTWCITLTNYSLLSANVF